MQLKKLEPTGLNVLSDTIEASRLRHDLMYQRRPAKTSALHVTM